MSDPARPPRLLAALLRAVYSDGVVGRSILGDLAEEFVLRSERDGLGSARLWYRRNAVGLIARGLWARLWDLGGWAERPRSEDSGMRRRGDPMLTQWLSEITRAIRALSRAPGFTFVTVLTLGLAIGANAAIFSVVKGVLLEALPYEDSGSLVAIKSSTPGNNTPPEFGVSPEFYVYYNDVPALSGLALYSGFGGTVKLDGAAERVRGAEVSYDFFETLGVTPVIGRLPTLDDVRDSGTPNQQQEAQVGVILISHAFWQQSLGGDPTVVGTSLDVNDRLLTIIGVMPPELRIPENETAIWVPFHTDQDNVQIGSFTWNLIGRLAEGVEPEDLAGQLAQVADRLPEIYDGAQQYVAFLVDGQYRPIVHTLKDEIVGDLEQPLWILLGTVGFVLLIACANVANLFLVRAESRQRDMAVRAAMGAGRRLLVRAHLAEAVVLATVGGVLGALLAWVGVPLLTRAAPAGIPRIDLVRLDGGVLGFTAMLSLASAVLFGFAAAIRYSSPKLLGRLRSAGRGAIGGRDRHFARNALVVTQSGLALVLLVGSGLLVKSFAELMNTDPGFESDNILSFQVALPFESYSSAATMADFHSSMMERIAALPGVESVGAVQELPLDEGASGTAFTFDQPSAGEAPPSLSYYTYASQGYFETMGIGLLAGRTFTRADHETELGNAIVSRAIAERVWPGEDPIGKRLVRTGDQSGWEIVVGVVEDVRDRDLTQDPVGMIYLPFQGRNGDNSWFVSSPAYTVRTASEPTALFPMIRDEIRSRDSDLPIYRVQTMKEVVAESVEQLSFTMLALGVSAVMALLLGAVGLYGVLSYLVSQRKQEIGVRLALGAEAVQVRRMVVSQGARLAAVGLVAGLLVSSGLTRILEGLLYGTEPLDPMTFGGMSVVMMLVCLLASYVPARRASSVDPLESMRAE